MIEEQERAKRFASRTIADGVARAAAELDRKRSFTDRIARDLRK